MYYTLITMNIQHFPHLKKPMSRVEIPKYFPKADTKFRRRWKHPTHLIQNETFIDERGYPVLVSVIGIIWFLVVLATIGVI